jgi:hypothetical protein
MPSPTHPARKFNLLILNVIKLIKPNGYVWSGHMHASNWYDYLNVLTFGYSFQHININEMILRTAHSILHNLD